MRTHLWLLLPVLASCDPNPPGGTQIGALKVDNPPEPPTDFKDLDMVAAVGEAFQLAGVATLSTAWSAHVATMDRATTACPTTWIGAPPDTVVDIDGLEDGELRGLSWADECATLSGHTFRGYSYWSSQLTDKDGTTSGERDMAMDGVIRDAKQNLLLDFDGEASDSIEFGSGSYASTFVARQLSGSLLGAYSTGLRGEMEAEWSGNAMRMIGSVHVEDGFGPPDTRNPDPEVTPELANLPGWEPGMPRFTSVRFDLEVDDDCALEPKGYVGVRGNEGFWFDVYFLPLYDIEEDPALASAFPFEEIDNVACDGIGTVFVRNLDLKEEDEADQGWSREISVDLGAIMSALPTPTERGYVFTLQDLPKDPIQ